MVLPVVIAGAGIGGLTLAAALTRRGVPVSVLERARDLLPVGAGITVQPNAILALRRLGKELRLDERIAAEGAAIGRTSILNARGQQLGPAVDFSEMAAELGAPAIAIHRGRLQRVLLEAAGDVVRTATRVLGYEPAGSVVRVRLEGGESVDAELLVGADGLRSAVRAQMLGEGEPVYRGYTSWRGVTPAGAAPPVSQLSESWGRGLRFGIVPIGHGEVYWFAVADADAGGRDDDVRAELLAVFGHFHAPVRALIEATPAERIVRTDIVDREVVTRWTDGRVALLGDAAHPMTPNFGQGGCQAIEDAIVLDEVLSRGGGRVEDALTEYAQRRAARANGIVVGARRFGAVAQWRNPVACALRDLLMRLTPASASRAQLRRLSRFEGGA